MQYKEEKPKKLIVKNFTNIITKLISRLIVIWHFFSKRHKARRRYHTTTIETLTIYTISEEPANIKFSCSITYDVLEIKSEINFGKTKIGVQ